MKTEITRREITYVQYVVCETICDPHVSTTIPDLHRGILSIQLKIGGSTTINFHSGNPPFVQYSLDGSTYFNYGNIFFGVS